MNLEASIDSKVAGVRIGAQTYSFRDLPRPAGASDAVDVMIKALTDSGLSECELLAQHLEPVFPAGRGERGAPPSPEAVKARNNIRQWRLDTSLDHFKNVRKKFDAAGITIHAYCYNMNSSFTDAELDRGFEIARALGTDVDGVDDAGGREAPDCGEAQNHRRDARPLNVSDPNEFATPTASPPR
jgi:hypothetical protein